MDLGVQQSQPLKFLHFNTKTLINYTSKGIGYYSQVAFEHGSDMARTGPLIAITVVLYTVPAAKPLMLCEQQVEFLLVSLY